ncbi:hypothetical protein [Bauldia litoralis]|uniref:Uncharacterized protein n=1 Tax=Bauldia litoralis TaxID=665467 RepID=A0A1G6DU64_9HYPH|nr:hypothetical protein [Bauldia litoralis]SDB48689.1 hypothetical protein SAMN02982931_03779 [Bauldia litoralis]
MSGRITNMISQIATLKRTLRKTSNINVARTVLSIFDGAEDLVSFDPNPRDGPFVRVTLCAVPSGSFFYAKPMDPTKPSSVMVRLGPVYAAPEVDDFEEVNRVIDLHATTGAKPVTPEEDRVQHDAKATEKLTEVDQISSIEAYRKAHKARLIEKMKELN